MKEVGRPVRRTRLEVEVVYLGEEDDITALIGDAINNSLPNAAWSLDEIEPDVELVPVSVTP